MIKIEGCISPATLEVVKRLEALVSPSLENRISNWISSFFGFNFAQDALMSEKVVVSSSFKGKTIKVEMGILANLPQLIQNVKDAASSAQQEGLQINHCVIRPTSSKKCDVYISGTTQIVSINNQFASGFTTSMSQSSFSKILKDNLNFDRSQTREVINYFRSKDEAVSKPAQAQKNLFSVTAFFESVKKLFTSKQEIIAVACSNGKLISIKKYSVDKKDFNASQGKCYAALLKATRALPEVKKGNRRVKVGLCQLERGFFGGHKMSLIKIDSRNKAQMADVASEMSVDVEFYQKKIAEFLDLKSTKDQERIQSFLTE